MKIREIKPKYIPGDPWCYCDICGLKYRKSQTKKQWNGFIACEKCFDEKHPQLEPVHVEEQISVEDARPLGDPVFHDPITPDDL